MPLDVLMKHYAGAYAEGFDWPQPSPHHDEEEMDETEGLSLASMNGPHVQLERPIFSVFLFQKWSVKPAVHPKQC